MTSKISIIKLNPAALVLSSFLLLIVCGAFLLTFDMATTGRQISWIDALFTTTSAVCVTGLTVVDTGTSFTTFGQCVILALIQIGGLGVMTISVALFTWIGRSVSIRHRKVMQDLFAHTPRQDIYKLVRSVIIFTLATELTGAILLTIHWSKEMPLRLAMYNGIFHSISAFCNAGFRSFYR